MITNVDWIALITLIAIVWIQIPYHNGNSYSALPVWLEYITARLIYPKEKKSLKLDSSATLCGGLFFSVVWFILYSLITATAYLMYTQPSSVFNNSLMQTFYALFLVNIILNKLWTPMFFGEYKFFSCRTPPSDTISEDTFQGGSGDGKFTFRIQKLNLPTAVRVLLAGGIAFLIFASAASILGIIGAMVGQDVITDTATIWVSLFTYSLYTLWTFAAILMNLYINVMVCYREKELKELLPK